MATASKRQQARTTAVDNPMRALPVFGQSAWLDYIRRSMFGSGELRRLIDEDRLCGVTSNPAIFEKAINGSSDYRDLLEAPDAASTGPIALYERLAIRDIREAADTLRPVYEQTRKHDGYVSLEVSPLLAHDTARTIDEARRLWREVDRANLMVKVPATSEGIPAMRALIAEGINVNVTLLFARDAYERVAEAYIEGLETLAKTGADLSTVASVASFFVSRIDTAVDALLDERLMTTAPSGQGMLRALIGKVAIANAKLAYQRYLGIFGGLRWRALAGRGAQTQRLLWASTGTKNPSYRDVIYIEELIGPDTVNTMPPATLDAFRDHGRPRSSLTEDVDGAWDVMAALADTGIELEEVTDRLLDEGLQLFSDAFAKLLTSLETRAREGGAGRINRLTWTAPPPMKTAVEKTFADWRDHAKVRRLWARDASLWTGKDEAQWLGWLGITDDQLAQRERFTRIADAARNSEFTHAVLLGMGGSSLCADVMRAAFGRIEGFPELLVLDSTDPAQVKTIERTIDLPQTLFIVSSKSGSTLEPDIFRQYFFARVEQAIGREEAGRHFVAITDPGSMMQHVAERDGFRHVFPGWPSIGGRYSALSDFGLVPAAIMGIDVPKLLDRTQEMVCACASSVPVEENPAVVLGAVIGVAARDFGRDKLTLVASPAIAGLGAWIEQLVAESTGKAGKGVIPIDREPLGPPDVYSKDRLFVYMKVRSTPDDPAQEAAMEAIERADHPVVRIVLDDLYDLGEEFFRWELATAVAGSILGIHPFDQPDVEASKNATRRLTADYEKTGTLPPETPLFEAGGLALFADPWNADAILERERGRGRSLQNLTACLRSHLDRIGAGDYFALLAYVEMNGRHDAALQAIRRQVRDARRVATCVAYGPRFLHSTGQAYKGGPDSGVFLQITCGDEPDLQVPGRKYTFGIVKAAQARGDFEVLAARRRRILRVDVGANPAEGLRALQAAIGSALESSSRG